MAHKILGVDLGTWSVKVAELEAGFRTSRLVGLYERPLLERNEGETDVQRAARTVGALVRDHDLQAEMFATTLGGEATMRLISLPFSDPKKIDQVLGYELESQILGELEGLVIDNVIAQTTPQATHVIAVAAPKDMVRGVIDVLAQVDCEPRVVGAAALSYAALRGHSFDDGQYPQVIVDIGHRHTHVCVAYQQRVLFARSIPRGGEDVTRALMEQFKLEPAGADDAKHAQAFIAPAGSAAESPAHRRVDQVVREAVRPLLRELRQTLAAYRAGGGAQPERLLLTGGGARLRGLLEHLEVELGLPASRLDLRADDPFVAVGADVIGGDRLSLALPAQALGLALAAAAPVPQVNLRKGELAYRSDYSYLRGKAGYMTAAILAILMFAAVNAAASLRGLRKEAEGLEAQLKRETVELFGEARLDGKAVSEELRQGPKGGGAPPIPNMSAYDLLDEISRHVPPPEKGKLDVLELTIKPKKIYLKGTAESAAQVDELAQALEKIECFEKVEKGKISVVTSRASGESKEDKTAELKQFDLTINSACN
jgi:general secretion pathway protein L